MDNELKEIIRDLHQPLFSIIHLILFPVRYFGFWGTPNNPVYFEKDRQVPFHIELKFPLEMGLRFAVDCETYYENGKMVVRPTWKDSQCLMVINNCNIGLVQGAPTVINGKCRKELVRKPISTPVLV